MGVGAITVTGHWLASLRGKFAADDVPLRSIRYVVLDTELTSLDHRTNRLLSVGAVAMDGDRIRLGEFLYRVVNPGCEIPAEGILVHGLRPADIEAGESPNVVMGQLRRFLGDAVIVGHFVDVDTKVLRKELRGTGSLDNPVLDTAAVHRWLVRHEHHVRGLYDIQDRCDLASLAAHYDLEMRDAHHALYDAFLTAQLWQKQIPRLELAGVRTLRTVLRASR